MSVLEPDTSPPPEVSAMQAQGARVAAAEGKLIRTLIALWPYIWPRDRRDLQWRVVLSLVLVVIAKLVTVTVPYTFKWATDALVASSGGRTIDSQTIAWLIGAPITATAIYGLTRILMAMLMQAREGLFAQVAMHAVRRLALETFEHMHRLSLRFHLERKTGGLTRVLERGRNGIEELSRMAMMTLLPTIIEFLLVLAVCWFGLDWRYAAVVLVMIIIYLGYTIQATNWRIHIRRSMNDSDTDANTKAIDSLLNYETVKYFGSEAREASRYDRSMAGYERAKVKTYTSLAVLNAGQAVIFTIGMTICMVMSAMDILNGDKTVGHFIMVNALLVQLYIPLNFMGMVYREIKQALVDIEVMFTVMGQPEEVADVPHAKPLIVSKGNISFKDVKFHYNPDRAILKGISFDVPHGKTVAIVGPSGAGKSTISRLLFRFYDLTSGSITIDGQDISAVQQRSLRSAIGMVPQDTVLFNDTILYNIGYGRWEASTAEIEEAARMAQMDAFIKHLPEGYETQVGERGLKLSGGEKQRVAIARTILKAPPILVLDEATSALDSFTEREIQDSLDRVSRGRTTVVIAHRLSTVIHADQIIVLDKGEIVERGTHGELLDQRGVYAALWQRQREVDAAREILKRADEAESQTLRVKIEV
jgi:ABC-type transport system involved in Fe-S cluster assembly fused permease/ATPase subunit